MRRTKIISTFGPSISDPKILKEVCKFSDVIRINLAHGTWDESEEYNHKKNIHLIQEISKDLNKPVGIQVDLRGNKIRISDFKNHFIELENASEIDVIFTEEQKTDNHEIFIDADYCFSKIEVGDKILLDDGLIQLIVNKVDSANMKLNCIVENGGLLKANKGFEVENKIIHRSGLGEEDKRDIERLAELNIDWIALSFVQKLKDVEEVKKYIGDKAGIIAKIEKPSALEELDEIIQACDGVMVARGDLGVELPPEEVPGIQKEIILKCRQAGKPVIVATQMLESMIEAPSPTRAEASDVATAVFDGADAVMLSAETAVGSYPIETVNIMDRIITSAENHIKNHPGDGPQNLRRENFIYNAVSRSAVSLAESVRAKAVVAFTASGNTAYRMSRERSNLLLVVMTPDINVKRKLSLLWGACPFFSKVQGYEAAIQEAREIIKTQNFAMDGDTIVVVAGMPFGISGSTNSIRVVEI